MKLDSRIEWRFARLDRIADCSAEHTWLSPTERDTLAALRDATRRAAWLGARILAKQLILLHENRADAEPAAIEVVSRDLLGRGHRPRVSIGGRAMPWSVSIAHTETAVLVALCTAAEISVGVDLVGRESLGPGFLKTWFDGREQALAHSGGQSAIHRLWAVKEAAYKAINRGDAFTPRQIRARRRPDGAYTCVYRGVDLAGSCRVDTWPCAGHVAALATFHHDVLPGRKKGTGPICAQHPLGRSGKLDLSPFSRAVLDHLGHRCAMP